MVIRAGISRPLPQRRAIIKLRGADRPKEIFMDIIAIEIIATVALLVAHLTIVIRNRFMGGR